MISVISPAKSLDFKSAPVTELSTQPNFIPESEKIISKLRNTSKKRIREMMNISKDLVELNYQRYHEWEPEFTPGTSKQAILAFNGDVYQGLQAETLLEEDFDFAQNHLRILSGLHGILRPMDLIRPYRLEMGTKLKVGRRENLYQFWQDKIYKILNESIEDSGSKVLINLASNEYFDAIDAKKVKADIFKVDFKDLNNGQFKVLSFFAKKARGMMARYIIQHRINNPEGLKSFDSEGYQFMPEESTDSHFIFHRQ